MAARLEKLYWSAFTAWRAGGESRLPYRSLERIVALQSRRVRAIVAHAYETVPYYREVMDHARIRPADIRTADDLARLPVLTGDQVARDPDHFLSSRFRPGSGLELHSSGTSGRFRLIRYDAAALFTALAHGHRQRIVLAAFVGRTFGYREMVAFRPGSISFKIREFYQRHSWTPSSVDLERSVLSPTDTFDENVARMNRAQPDVLFGYGSYLGALFRYASERHLETHRPRAVLYGGDRMADADRALLETGLGVPVLSSYQAAEALRIAFQCERRQGFHLDLDLMGIRIVDETGAGVKPGGTGEIVISNLTNRATVLLNYKQGDVVTLSEHACPCGRTLPTIERIEGRSDDLILLADGRVIHALAIQAPLHRVPGVIQVQIVQHTPHDFLVRAVCTGDDGWPSTRSGLEAALRSVVGADVSAAIERVERIPTGPGGKIKAAISHCLPGPSPG